jgi:hypothetical protein
MKGPVGLDQFAHKAVPALNLVPGSHNSPPSSPLCSTLSVGRKKPVSIDSQSPTCKEMEAGQGA